jgi:hypothetical protein
LPLLTPAILNPRRRSLIRGSTIVLIGVAIATWMSHFPHLSPNLLITLPLLGCFVGAADTIRCMQKRWSFYHAGVILCLYMDLMAITLVLFFLLYPYLVSLGSSR